MERGPRRGWDGTMELDSAPLYDACRSMYPFGVWDRGVWMLDIDVALEFALAHEEAAAPRPAAMSLQQREHMVALLAQRGLRPRELQLHILEFAGLAKAPRLSDASRAR